MAPPAKRRRQIVEEDPDEDAQSEAEAAHTSRTRRQRMGDSSDEEAETEDPNMDEDAAAENGDQDQLVKKLVRYAMACDYSRVAIRRDDIRTKVIGQQKANFKLVFQMAQNELQHVFGMQMVELPSREKVTLRDRMAASRSAADAKPNTQALTSNAFVLTSILPAAYRDPAILPPSSIPTTSSEASYTGIYTMIYTLIALNGGRLADAKLDRYLKRLNADINTPIDKTEALMTRMIKQGYIVRIKENVAGDEVIEWMAGPRGKVEIGNSGVEGLVMDAYGQSAPDDLTKRVATSLGLGREDGQRQNEAVTRVVANGRGAGRGNSNGNSEGSQMSSRTRIRRAAAQDEDADY